MVRPRPELTALHEAAAAGDLALARRLFEKYGTRLLRYSPEANPLHAAARGSHVEMATFLMDRGIYVDAGRREGVLLISALFEAAAHGSPAMVEVLLKNGANVNCGLRDWSLGGHSTPLHWAVKHGKAENVRLLLAHGAEVNARDECGNTPLALAEDVTNSEIASVLRQYGGRALRRRGGKVAQIDLRPDYARMLKMVATGVNEYALKSGTAKTWQAHPPVSAIALRFGIGEHASVDLCFDARPKHDADGVYSHQGVASLAVPHWQRFCDKAARDGGELTDERGRVVKLSWNESTEVYVGAFGAMLVNALKDAKSQGLFAKLPRCLQCEFSVEEMEGYYGWPAFQERGKENMIP
jgi:ankyrin repeat protein